MEPAGGGLPFCDACEAALTPAECSTCPRCGAEGGDGQPSSRCVVCRERPFHFDSVVALGPYQGVLRDAVLRTKRQSGERLAAGLAGLLADRRAERLASFAVDAVVPVPMHWQRRIARGGNAPEALAVELARHRGVPADVRVLYQCRKTLPQKDLLQSERFRNVRGAFRVARGYDLRGARLLLVDDILTSGATCSEAAGVLKRAGAASVAVAILARASATATD